MKRIILLLTLAFGFSAVELAALDRAVSADESRLEFEPTQAVTLAPVWFQQTGEGKTTPEGDIRIFKGRRSYSESRALDDAWRVLQMALADWLGPEVPNDWTPPRERLDSLIVARHIEPVATDAERFGLDPTLDLPEVLYLAAYKADFSPQRRAELVQAYQQEVGVYRLTVLGGVIAFILTCLGIVSGYIRADEATKGYYTNRLRLIAATAAGAAGVLIYQLLT